MPNEARRTLRLSKPYLLLTVLLFATEVLIAVAVHDSFVRPIVGDVLVVVLIYTALRSVLALRPVPTAIGVFVFACMVEGAQYARVVDVLGLRHNEIARVVIGTSYDPRDFLAYAAGALLVVVGERVVEGRRG